MNAEDAAVSAQEMKPALAAHFYSSPEVFRIETQRLFHGQWFCVGRADQVPSPGDCLHVSVAGESIVVLRGRDDALRAFYNVCRHRGSRLLRTPPLPDPALPEAANSGRVAAGVVCPYHAWTYNLDGTLRAAPYVHFDAGCPKEQFSLVPVQLDTWGGFVFVNLAEKPADAARANSSTARAPAGPLSARRSAPRRADRLRREGELEDHHGELQRVLSLRTGAPGALRARAGLPRARAARVSTGTTAYRIGPAPGRSR